MRNVYSIPLARPTVKFKFHQYFVCLVWSPTAKLKLITADTCISGDKELSLIDTVTMYVAGDRSVVHFLSSSLSIVQPLFSSSQRTLRYTHTHACTCILYTCTTISLIPRISDLLNIAIHKRNEEEPCT